MNLGGITNNFAGITNVVPGLLGGGGGGQQTGSSSGLSSLLGSILGGGGNGALLNDLVDVAPNIAVGSTINSKQHGGRGHSPCGGPPTQCLPPPCGGPPAAPGSGNCGGLFPPALPPSCGGTSPSPPAGCDRQPAPAPTPGRDGGTGNAGESGDGLLSPIVNNFGGITNISGGGRGGGLLNDVLDVAPNLALGSNVSNCQNGAGAPTQPAGGAGDCGCGSTPAPAPGCGGAAPGCGGGAEPPDSGLLSQFLNHAFKDCKLDNNELQGLALMLAYMSGAFEPRSAGGLNPSASALTQPAPSASWLT